MYRRFPLDEIELRCIGLEQQKLIFSPSKSQTLNDTFCKLC